MPQLSQRFAFRFEAEIAAEFLAEHEIEAFVLASDAGGAIPALQTTDGVRLEITSEDLARAEELIREWRSDGADEPAPLSSQQRIQSWLMGGALLLVLVWILGSIFWSAENRLGATERNKPPAQAQTP